MKLRFFIIGLAILFLIGTVSAYDGNFTVPDNYTVTNSSNNYIFMERDQSHTISISLLNSSDKDLLKGLFERSMYDFTYTRNYTKGDYVVEEDYYNQEYQRGIVYFCENGEEMIVIDYKVPVIEKLDDSPVDVILDGLN